MPHQRLIRVGVDAHALGTDAGGNETYMRELLYALRDHAHELDLVAYVHPQALADSKIVPGVPTHLLPVTSSYLRVPFALPWAARRVQVLHVQYNAPPYCPCPFVVSVHDIVWKRHPKLLLAADRYRLMWLVPGTLRRAARVFALTHAMAEEIAAEYRVPLDRFDIVQPSVDPLFAPTAGAAELEAVRRKYHLPAEYLLYIGALQPRKNLARVATAFSRLKEHGLPHSLVVVGKRSWLYGDMLAEIEALKLGDRLRLTGYVPREDLPSLLGAATAFVYASLYEGFGIPILEAMACGTPVLTSCHAAIREVAGDAAFFCDPLDADSIEQGLVRILTDAALRARLREAGPQRAATFTRKRMAEAALEGYRKAIAA
jgi:glycosyltransferase involved in cell wall biosynthesis